MVLCSTLYDIAVIYTFTRSRALSRDLDDVAGPDVKVFNRLVAQHDVRQLAGLCIVLAHDFFSFVLGHYFVLRLIVVVRYLDRRGLFFRQEKASPKLVTCADEKTSKSNLFNHGSAYIYIRNLFASLILFFGNLREYFWAGFQNRAWTLEFIHKKDK